MIVRSGSYVPGNRLVSSSDNSFRYLISRIVTWLVFLMYLLILLSNSISSYFQAKGNTEFRFFDEAMLVAFSVPIIVGSILTKKVRINVTIVLAALLMVYSVLVSLVNDVPLRILILGVLLLVKPLLILAIYQQLPLERRAVSGIFRQIRFLLTALPLLCLLYLFWFEILLGFNPIPGEVPSSTRFGMTASRSFFVHPSPFSSVMLICAIYQFVRIQLGYKSAIGYISLALAVLGVFLSLRIKAMLFLPFGFALVFFLVSRKLTADFGRIIKQVVIVLAAVTAIFVIVFMLQTDFNVYFGVDSDAIRTLLLKGAIQLNLDTFGFGVGAGMYGSAISVHSHFSRFYYLLGIAGRYGATPDYSAFVTDQWWSWYLGEIGLWGTSIFVLALLLGARYLLTTATEFRHKIPEFSILAYTALAVLSFGVLTGFADPNLTSPPAGYLIMSLVGIVYSLHRTINSRV